MRRVTYLTPSLSISYLSGGRCGAHRESSGSGESSRGGGKDDWQETLLSLTAAFTTAAKIE